MTFEIKSYLSLKKLTVETPVIETESSVIEGKKIGLIPILRAGIGMVDGMLQLLPVAKVGNIGLYRDQKPLLPEVYDVKLQPENEERILFVLDLILATGESANDELA